MEIQTVLARAAFRPEKMSKVNLFESQRFFCDVYCLRPGQEQARHSHRENDKLYYVLKGSAEVSIGEETAVLHAGEIVHAPAGVEHGIANRTDTDVVCLVFMAPHP